MKCIRGFEKIGRLSDLMFENVRCFFWLLVFLDPEIFLDR